MTMKNSIHRWMKVGLVVVGGVVTASSSSSSSVRTRLRNHNTNNSQVHQDQLAVTNNKKHFYSSSLTLPTFIDSHMALQREPFSSKIWGWTKPGLDVTIELSQPTHLEDDDDEQREFVSITTTTTRSNDDDGSWEINLPPQPASVGWKISISDGIDTITLYDIVFGDVYLCSGQSNMEMAVKGAFNATNEIQDSIHYPNLRLATVARATSDVPEVNVTHKGNYTWGRATPNTVNGEHNFDVYSATCYFFGRELYKSLNGQVPIGLITSCWGGQRVETFSSPTALSDHTCGGTRPMLSGHQLYNESVEKDLDHVDDFIPVGDGPKSMQLWNAMIHPLLPMRFTGVVWYQGEANADDAGSYACRFPAMINDWRNQFQLPDLMFLYVELAAYHPGTTWPMVRQAQRAALQLPLVGYATAIDIGDPSSPNGAVHPRRKQEVGRRLALQGRSIQYKQRSGLVISGPQLSGVQFQHDIGHYGGTCVNCTSIVLSFVPGTADGLHARETPECNECCAHTPFQILSNSTAEWIQVDTFTIRQSEGEVVLTTSQIQDIVGIRYAYEPYPECVIYNGIGGSDDHVGLPSSPYEWCLVPSGKPSWTGGACQTKQISNEMKLEQPKRIS